MKQLDANLDLGLDGGQMDHNINQATLLEQNKQLLEEIKTFNVNLSNVHEDGQEMTQKLDQIKDKANTIVSNLEKALEPKSSYKLKQEFQKICDDSNMMIIATKDGCIREFNDNVDKKALEFGDAADKKMDEAIKWFNEATKTNKRMSMSSSAYYILLFCVIILAMFFASIIMVNIMRYHDPDLTWLILGFAASIIFAIGSMLYIHYKFGDE